MAAMNSEGVRVKQIDVSDGYVLYFEIPVRTLVAMRSPVALDYQIGLPLVSISWRLGIIYQQEEDTGKVSCFIFLQRTDNENGHVNASVSLSYLDAAGRAVRYPRSLCSSRMYAGNAIHGSIEESRYPGLRSYIFSLGLFLQIRVSIRDYQDPSVIYVSSSSDSNGNKIHFSKL